MSTTAVTIPAATDLAKADWIERRDIMAETLAGVRAIATAEQADTYAPVISAATRHVKVLAEQRLAVTRQLDAAKKDIMAQEQALAAPLVAEATRVQGLVDGYAAEQYRKAEAERQRIIREQVEMARREAAEAADRASAQRQAEEAARLANLPPPPPPEPVKVAVVEPPPPPPAEAPKVAGRRVVTRWTLTVADPAAVPRQFCVPDQRLLRTECDRQLAAGAEAPAIPGCAFAKTVTTEGR